MTQNPQTLVDGLTIAEYVERSVRDNGPVLAAISFLIRLSERTNVTEADLTCAAQIGAIALEEYVRVTPPITAIEYVRSLLSTHTHSEALRVGLRVCSDAPYVTNYQRWCHDVASTLIAMTERA